MKIINLIPGSPEWLQSRSASKAPAMMGDSNYQTRNELLCQMATGITKDVDAATQARFDNGHRTEALSRAIAEEIIGDELSPISASDDDGYLTANYDGITFLSKIGYEHKDWNEKLAASVRNGVVPNSHAWQLDQQILVGDLEYVLFVVSDGTKDNFASIEYRSTKERADALMAGWRQFDIDRANYQHIEHIEKPKAKVCIELPALFVHARGEITEHNMEVFGVALKNKLAEVRAIALVTDQDFSNAKAAAKMFRDKAQEIRLAKEAMLSQTVTIGEAARMMDAWDKDLNSTALQLEKDVEREDLAKKRVMVGEAGIAFSAHVEALESETRPIQLNVPRPDFSVAIKNKRTYASMQGALDDALAQGRIDADAIAKVISSKLKWFSENTEDNLLFPDLDRIIIKPFDDFTLTVKSRISEHQQAEAAKLEAERARIQAEEEAKAKASQDALLAAERAKMEAEVRAKAEAEAARIAVVKELERTDALDRAVEKEQAEAAAIEERRKQAQIADQIKPVRLSGLKTAVAQSITPRRPNRAELLDAVATTFGTTNEAALDWILQEFRGDIQHEERKAMRQGGQVLRRV